MKTTNLIFFLFISLISISGCSVFKSAPKVTQEKIWQELWQSACPTSEGKGQIFISKRTYAFTYESVFNLTDNFWAIAMEVPVRGEENLVVPMNSKAIFDGSLLASLDKKTLKAIKAETFATWKKSWVELLTFLQQRSAWSQKVWDSGICKNSLKTLTVRSFYFAFDFTR